MLISKSILAASAILAAVAISYGAYARDWQLFAMGAILLLPLAYNKLALKVALKNGPEVSVDASRVES